MFVSEYLGLNDELEEMGVFDCVLDNDSRFFINLMRLKVSDVPEFKWAYQRINDYFSEIATFLNASDSKEDKLYKTAFKRFKPLEINGINLGFSKSKYGAAFGKKLREQVISDAFDIVKKGIQYPEIFQLVSLFEENIGPDRLSDMANEEGSAQGNIISPILANIYMHNVLTLWYKFIITKECKGDNFLIVYADDFVAGFQYKWEAENYYKLLKERMEKFGLQLEDSKSRLLQSGAYIARAKQKSGECIRLQTFDFLGFTFYCGRSRKGMPYIMPKTSSKKFRQKIRDIKVWLYANRDQPLKKLMGMLNLKLIGHYRYYGISFNGRMISNYKQQVRELLFKVLNRRSDRKSYTREGFIEMLKYYPLAMPKIYVSLF